VLRPARIRKIRIFVRKDYFDAVLHALSDLGTFQLLDAAKDVKAGIGIFGVAKPTEITTKCSSLLSRIEVLITDLEIHEKPVRKKFPVRKKSLEEILGEIEKEVTAIEEEYKSLSFEMKDLAEVPEEALRKKDVRGRLSKLVKENGDKLLEMREFLNSEKLIAEAKLKTVEASLTSLIEGWVPAYAEPELTNKVKEASKGYSVVDVGDPEHGDHPPAVIRNPSFARPFEKLVKAYGLPSHNEVDPTIFIVFTFPLIFGIMFGDIGHGIILTVAGLLVIIQRKKGLPGSEIIRSVFEAGELLLLCGISAIIGGLIFGEFFGYHLSHFGIETPPLGFILEYLPSIGRHFSPIEEPMLMFKLALLVGTMHISLGISLNLFGKLANKEYKEALIEPVCWLWFYVGLMYLVLLGFGVNIDTWTSNLFPTVTLLVILPIIFMFVGKIVLEGFIESFSSTFEIVISSLGNTVSYGRILALALVHGVLGQVLTMADALGLIGVAIIAIGTIFLIMMLEGLIVFIHTVRLHWVEWFSKFYKGEGTEYKPFVLQK